MMPQPMWLQTMPPRLSVLRSTLLMLRQHPQPRRQLSLLRPKTRHSSRASLLHNCQ